MSEFTPLSGEQIATLIAQTDSLESVLNSINSLLTAGVVLSFPDNEPFNLAQYGGLPVGAGNAIHIQSGDNATFSVMQNTNPWIISGAVTQSGSWTVDTELTTADLDTGAGTDTRAVVGLVGTASGGGQLLPGSSVDGLLVNLGANNDVSVTGTVTTVPGVTGIGHGVKTVAVAGTDESLAASTPCKRVTIQAQTDNTNAVAIGAAGVDATIATGNGIILYPGDVFELEIDNLADVFVDSLVNGEGVRFTYFN